MCIMLTIFGLIMFRFHTYFCLLKLEHFTNIFTIFDTRSEGRHSRWKTRSWPWHWTAYWSSSSNRNHCGSCCTFGPVSASHTGLRWLWIHLDRPTRGYLSHSSRLIKMTRYSRRIKKFKKKLIFLIYIADRKAITCIYRQSFFCSAVLTPQNYHWYAATRFALPGG